MSKILLLYWHGLGDLILLTPQLRRLHKEGNDVDLICRRQAIASHLLDACPYVNKLIPVPYDGGGPAEGGKSGAKKREQCFQLFNKLSPEYDKSFEFSERAQMVRGGKIHLNNKVCGFKDSDDLNLEVFISQEAETEAAQYIKEHCPNGYIFQHTMIEWHQWHNWDAEPWIMDNLDNLPIINTGMGGSHARMFKDINTSFVMAREAKHRVLSSSVFVHACDAMNAPMDVVYYGRPNPHGWPLDEGKIRLVKGHP